MDNLEVGRKIKVSDLWPGMVVVTHRPPAPFISVLVVAVEPEVAVFSFSEDGSDVEVFFIAKRTGKDLEEIADDSGRTIHLFEYLGV